MKEELNNIIRTIEDHFKTCLWDKRPPIKEIDFQLVVLSQRIIELRDDLNNIKDVDKAISNIMTFMEGTFHIPMLDYAEWLKQNEIRHQLVLDIYNKLSNLRSI